MKHFILSTIIVTILFTSFSGRAAILEDKENEDYTTEEKRDETKYRMDKCRHIKMENYKEQNACDKAARAEFRKSLEKKREIQKEKRIKKEKETLDEYFMKCVRDDNGVIMMYGVFYVAFFRVPNLLSTWLHNHTFVHYLIWFFFLVVLNFAILYYVLYNVLYATLLGKDWMSFAEAIQFAILTFFVIFVILNYLDKKRD